MIAVGCLGPEGTFSHIATLKFLREYNHEFKVVFYFNFKSLVEAFRNKEVDEIVVPIKNSTGKAVIDVLRELQQIDPFYGIREIYLKINQCLIGYGKVCDVKTIYSHPQGIVQCIGYISKLNDVSIKISESTAGSVKFISQKKNKSFAAIGSEEAAKKLNVPIINRNINDQGDNVTRFMLLNRNKTKPTGDDKTTLFFEIGDKTGSLEDILHIFTKNKINMSKLLSLPPGKESNTRVFFVDADGHKDDENFRSALDEAKNSGAIKCLSVFGSYVKAKII